MTIAHLVHGYISQLKKKEQIVSRMNCRRYGLMNFVLNQDGNIGRHDEGIWVDGKTFREFASCRTSIDSIFAISSANINRLKCEHGKVHPLNVHRGKFMSKESFEAYISLLRVEQRLIIEENGLFPYPTSQNGLSSKELYCEKCEKTYRKSLEYTSGQLELILNLYSHLAPLSNEKIRIKAVYPSQDWFAISRSFITSFQKVALSVMQDLTLSEEKGSKKALKHLSGLHSINVNDLRHFFYSSLDTTVNGKISCEYFFLHKYHSSNTNSSSEFR